MLFFKILTYYIFCFIITLHSIKSVDSLDPSLAFSRPVVWIVMIYWPLFFSLLVAALTLDKDDVYADSDF